MSSYLGRVTQLWKGRTSAPERKGPSPSLFHPKSLGKWGDQGVGWRYSQATLSRTQRTKDKKITGCPGYHVG